MAIQLSLALSVFAGERELEVEPVKASVVASVAEGLGYFVWIVVSDPDNVCSPDRPGWAVTTVARMAIQLLLLLGERSKEQPSPPVSHFWRIQSVRFRSSQYLVTATGLEHCSKLNFRSPLFACSLFQRV